MKSLGRLLHTLVRERDPAIPQLIGAGVDCIIQRTTHAPSDAQRRLRYAQAKCMFYSSTSRPHIERQFLALRKRLGERFQAAWSAGQFPRFNAVGRPSAIRFSCPKSGDRMP